MPFPPQFPSPPHASHHRLPVGIILSGGLSRRMGGGDKYLLDLGGAPIIGRVVDRLRHQVEALVLNANGDPGRFAEFNLPVVPDSIVGHPGPLAGILAGLDWAAAAGFDQVVSVAADTPFFPDDLVVRLARAAENASIVLASTPEGGLQPVFGLWSVGLRARLRSDILAGARRVGDWAGAQGCNRAVFPADGADPFFNINTAADLAEARARLAG